MSALRARLLFKLISLGITLVVVVMGTKACSGSSSPSSPLNPLNVARNGLSGLCANQQATADASGDPAGSPGTVVSSQGLAGLGDPAGGALRQALGGDLGCPTTTLPGGG